MLLTAAPTILVMFMFYYGWSGDYIARKAPADAMLINVWAQQWSWQFEYPNGKKDNELYVPQNKAVKLLLKSRDVNHGFFISAFGLKQDAIPGRDNSVWFEATQIASYDIQCTQYCGTQHSAMLSKVHVLSQEDFDKWYKAVPTATGAAAGEQLYKIKGCIACHSIDGSRLLGPSLKGLFGKSEVILADGQEQTKVVDEEYLKRAILDPRSKTVKGYPPGVMPPQQGLISEEELTQLIEFIKSIK